MIHTVIDLENFAQAIWAPKTMNTVQPIIGSTQPGCIRISNQPRIINSTVFLKIIWKYFLSKQQQTEQRGH